MGIFSCTGEKVRALLQDQASAPEKGAAAGVVTAAQHKRVRDILTQIVGINHAASKSRSEMVCAVVGNATLKAFWA